jgi:hypothetical protein
VNRHILSLSLCLVLVGLLAPAAVRGADGWSVSKSSTLVQADFISQSGSDAQLYLENNVSFEPFGLASAGAVLDALGFGGGYSQEVSWSSGGSPTVSCPKGLTDLFSFCSTNANGGWALIPDGLRTELSLTSPASGSRALDVRPGVRSLAYDGTVASIGIALETLSPGPIGSNATQVASLALQLLPEAGGFEAAMERKDYTTAGFELLSLSKRAMTIIADHVTQWAIGAIVDLVPGLAEVKLGIAVSKAVVVLANLDAHLLNGNSVTTVTVDYAGGGGANGTTSAPLTKTTPSLAVTPTRAPNAGTFALVSSMATHRQNHTATLLSNGRVLIAGGESGPLASAELYDPQTGRFSPTGSMNAGRAYHTATLLSDGRVLIAGGLGGSVWLASAELYDPQTGRFSPTGSMNADRGGHTATLLPDGRVLIVGGGPASAELYDPATGTFSPTGTMTTTREYQSATLLPDGRVLIAGGWSGGAGGSAVASAELYDPAPGTFRATGSMITARANHTATLLNDGRVLIAGGYGDASAELYDPQTGTFSLTGSMTASRVYPTATLVANGRVLIAGGGPTFGELYDPATGAFSRTGSMRASHQAPTATLLSDGRVLVVGGGDGLGGLFNSAELYQP